jgi:hypothetical protein
VGDRAVLELVLARLFAVLLRGEMGSLKVEKEETQSGLKVGLA